MIRPHGSWPSPISAAMVAAQGVRLGAPAFDGDDIYWLEGRPVEGGRTVLVRRTPDGQMRDITPPPFNVRTRVHEYGGGAYVVAAGEAWFSNFTDQRLYRVPTREADQAPVPVTPEGRWFYADGVVDVVRRRLVCVREDHSTPGAEPINTLVSIRLDGDPHAGDVIASGHDFYSTPRLSPDGARLCWLAWRHPQMPWDGTELWAAAVADDGTLRTPMLVAGGARESIYQPGWSPDGALYFVSDRDGWWRLYRAGGASRPRDAVGSSQPLEAPGIAEAVLRDPPAGVEFGRPEWVFGTSTWAFAGPDRMVVACTEGGRWRLATITPSSGSLCSLETTLEPLEWLRATPTHAIVVAASPTQPESVARMDLASGVTEVLRRSSDALPDPAFISVPEAIAFPTADGQAAHAFYYAPHNRDHAAPDDERPPLIVISHGGPTTATRDTLDFKVQFWTSRGFAVVDVNYRGSSGYGREYRQRLNGQWGVADVADTVHAARYLVSAGKADSRRLMVRGGSAGGYTALAALTFHPGVFSAGASYYGICDLEVLARDTHKFESRYLDSMIGPYPQRQDVYRARSPIHFVDRLACALILFQGLEDKVVPPNQSEMMADAVRAGGWPVAYLTFAGEQHGFRKADTIIRSLEAELYFYGAVFGFAVADDIAPVAIANPPRTDAR